MNRNTLIVAIGLGLLSLTGCQVRQVTTFVDQAVPNEPAPAVVATLPSGEPEPPATTTPPAPAPVATFCEGGFLQLEGGGGQAIEAGQPVPCSQPAAAPAPACTPGVHEGGEPGFTCP